MIGFCDLLDIKDTTYLTQTSEIMESVEWVISCHRPMKNLLLKVKSVFALDSVRLVRYDHENPLVNRVWLFVVVAVKDFIRML